jgi:hypothetical protein
MTASEEKTPIDWIVIETEYRAGIKPLRQIAEEHGITHGAINKRAKRDCWTRGFSPSTDKHPVVLQTQESLDSSGFLYVIFIDSGLERFYKIGMAKQFSSRFDQHQCSSPFEIRVALCYFVANMRAEERRLHAIYADQRVRGEWFALTSDHLAAIAQGAVLV